MSCCFPFRVCCPPDVHEQALAGRYVAFGVGTKHPCAADLARLLLAEVELAPLGLTAAVIAAWPQTDAALGAAVRAALAPSFKSGPTDAMAG